MTSVFRFLWVAFQVEDLCRQKSDAEIRQALKSLPKDLPETYQRALSRIVKDGNQKLASRIFRWIAVAKRPLRLEELREAIAVLPGDEFLDRERLVNNADIIVPSCGSLLVSDDEDIVVQFAHHTVQDFLLSEEYQTMADPFHFSLSEVDRMAGEICVTYLHFNDFKRQLIPRKRLPPAIQPSNILASTTSTGQGRVAQYGLKFARIVAKRSKTKFNIVQHLDAIASLERDDSLQLQMQYPFLVYARSFWLSHTKNFFQLPPSMASMWRQPIVTNHEFALQPWLGAYGEPSKNSLLDYIAEESHCALIDCLLYDAGREMEITEADMGVLICRASRKGTLAVVNHVLNKRLSPQMPFELGQEHKDIALAWAVSGGHMNVVDALLAAGADVNAGPTALQRAAEDGNLEMAELLIRAKADVNARLGYFGFTALQRAARVGHLEILERLLIAGADVNAPAAENGGFTALQAAARHGHLNVVRRLLSSHADVNAAPAKVSGCTVMEAAERSGNSDIMEILLKPLGVIQIHIQKARDLPLKSSYTVVLGSGVEKARTVTVQNTAYPVWDELLYLPVCYSTNETTIEVIGQDTAGIDHKIISESLPIREFMKKADGVFTNIERRRPYHLTGPGECSLYSAISFYPCLNSEKIPVCQQDDASLSSVSSRFSALDVRPLTIYEDDPVLFPEELMKYKTGFLVFKVPKLMGPALPRCSVQLQILVDDMLFTCFSTFVAETGHVNIVGNCFIRELDSSKITLRLNIGASQFDENIEGVLGILTANTLDILKKCLVCVLAFLYVKADDCSITLRN
jgi:ankyrin repeat protein